MSEYKYFICEDCKQKLTLDKSSIIIEFIEKILTKDDSNKRKEYIEKEFKPWIEKAMGWDSKSNATSKKMDEEEVRYIAIVVADEYTKFLDSILFLLKHNGHRIRLHHAAGYPIIKNLNDWNKGKVVIKLANNTDYLLPSKSEDDPLYMDPKFKGYKPKN